MGRFKFEDDHRYFMPAHFGGMKYVTTNTIYRDVTSLIIQYRTERDAIEPYVPEALIITEPILTVAFLMCRGVEWMAGGVYNLVAVNIPTRFDGQLDHVEADFALVVWENKVTPILPGREATGIPKIGATIEDARYLPPVLSVQEATGVPKVGTPIEAERRQCGRWYAEAAYEGNTFLELSLSEQDELPEQALANWNHQSRETDYIGWRYIPNVAGPGAALNHPTTFPQGSVVKSASRCTGAIKWKALAWEQAPNQAQITQALAGLPVLEVTAAYVTRGESVLYCDKARELH